MPTTILHQVHAQDKLYIAQNIKGALDPIFHCFSTDAVLEYEPLVNEFGPMSLSHVIRFVEILDHQIDAHPGQKIVYYAGQGKKKLTNAVFLLGTYIILKHDDTAKSVAESFRWLDDSLIERFRGTLMQESDRSELTLSDCWAALERAKGLAWLGLPRFLGGRWGRIDPDEYEQSPQCRLASDCSWKALRLQGAQAPQGPRLFGRWLWLPAFQPVLLCRSVPTDGDLICSERGPDILRCERVRPAGPASP